MKKLLFSLLIALTAYANAAPWDLNAQQYDQFGTTLINRLLPLPTGGVNGIYYYDAAANLPKLSTYDSSLLISGGVMQVNPSLLAGKFDTPTGNAGQYIAGNGTLVAFPTAISFFTNDVPYVTSAGLTSTLSAYATTSDLTSGLSTKFNSPSGTISQYVRGDGTLATLPAPGAGTVTSVIAGTGLSGGTITSSGTISMPNTGSAGTYSGVTTDAQGRVTAGTNASQSAQTRTLNSAYQINASRGTFVFYTIKIVTTASIGGNQDGEVVLEIASDSGFTTNVQTLAISQNAQAITLALTLQSIQTVSAVVSGYVPPAYYTRLRTVSTTGTPAFTYRTGQEILM